MLRQVLTTSLNGVTAPQGAGHASGQWRRSAPTAPAVAAPQGAATPAARRATRDDAGGGSGGGPVPQGAAPIVVPQGTPAAALVIEQGMPGARDRPLAARSPSPSCRKRR